MDCVLRNFWIKLLPRLSWTINEAVWSARGQLASGQHLQVGRDGLLVDAHVEDNRIDADTFEHRVNGRVQVNVEAVT